MLGLPQTQTILVTGGAGFVGSHLCERLLEAGHFVLCADSFRTGSKANIRHLLDRPEFELIRHDVINPLYVEVDQIYNLACPASPIHYQCDPIQTTKTSFMGALNMLGLAKRIEAPILQASTSEVYGDPSVHPQPEDYWGNVNTLGLRACYDEGKRVAETLFMDYRRKHQVDTKIVRIFNTYGPRMHPNDGRVVSNFIVQALLGRDLTIFGDGEQTRSFCYVDDLVEGLIRMMATDPDVSGPVNLGNPGEFTMKRTGRNGAPADRRQEQAGPRAAAARRSAPAPARHFPGEEAARLGADGGAGRGPLPHDRLFPQAARALMAALTIIPARGGSKGVPRKNLRMLAGKPLIAWSILRALEAEAVDAVLVSTDDEEIAEVARAHGAEAPFLRPAELATDRPGPSRCSATRSTGARRRDAATTT